MLTFMKNRLEIAKRLLTSDGLCVMSIDHNMLFYLGVLADEIFGKENQVEFYLWFIIRRAPG